MKAAPLVTVAVVTGAGRGIGRGTALRPGRDGHARHRITVRRVLPRDRRDRDVDQIDEGLGAYPRTGNGEALAQYSQLIALGRVRTPEDVAGFVSYPAGPDSDSMTGQSVMIDGGIVMS
jgi:meso-butanediol dehydrogenase/(S,S)-butanediol dehydrogenase/diacetyl reductase